jgi:hypothetical protein
MHSEHFLIGLIAGIFIMYTIVMICNSCNLKIAGLDNRPRWMMGGLRDDTGSHNANDVFALGYGLEQTKHGVPTVNGQFAVNNGISSLTAGNKTQTEYNPILGDK